MVNPKRETADAAATDDDGTEWDVIPTGGLGDEWDFEHDGRLDGHFIGSREVETPKLEKGRTNAYLLSPVTDPDRIVFVWESSEIEKAFGVADDGTSLIRIGDRVRISFLGERSFVSADGPRRIKQYKVEAAKRQ